MESPAAAGRLFSAEIMLAQTSEMEEFLSALILEKLSELFLFSV